MIGHIKRRVVSRVVALVIASSALGLAEFSHSAEPLQIVRIEEDWEATMNIPEPSLSAPQVTCVMSTGSSLEALHMVFEINHHSQPSYEAGGMQLQAWSDDALLAYRDNPVAGLLGTQGEVVSWTQVMKQDGTNVTFEITGGSSQTWGAFGGQGYLRTTQTASLPDLSAYTPNVSTQLSSVGYAGNRVGMLKLKTVRVYTAQGLLATLSLNTVVHQASGE